MAPFALTSPTAFAEVQLAAYYLWEEAVRAGSDASAETVWLVAEFNCAEVAALAAKKAARSASAKKGAATRKANKAATVAADTLLAQVVATTPKAPRKPINREMRVALGNALRSTSPRQSLAV